jgi:hypothetical protein
VEGEDYRETTFTHLRTEEPIVENAAASGGRTLKLVADDAPPAEGFTTTYEVSAPTAGYYVLEVTGSPFWKSYISPSFDFRVNGGDYRSMKTRGGRESAGGDLFSYQAGTVSLEAGVNTVTVRVDDRRRVGDPGRFVYEFDRLRFRPAPFAVESITGDAPMNVFTTAESVGLDVAFSYPATEEKTFRYTVTDYFGEVVDTGSIAVDAGASSVRLDLGSLQRGHYTVSTRFGASNGDGSSGDGEAYTAGHTTFFGVVTPPGDRRDVDHPFASMSGVSNTVPHDRMGEYADVLRRGGLSTVREISVRWTTSLGVNPAPGEFDWSAFDRWLDPLSEGNDLLYVNPNTPGWTRTRERTRNNRFEAPDDLRHAYDFVERTASRYRDAFEAWEVHNEPENNGALPHRLAPYTKMSAIAVRDSDADLPVVLPGWASGSTRPGPAETIVTTYESDLAPYVDVYNSHHYTPHEARDDTKVVSVDFPTVQYHDALRTLYGLEDLPYWVTEAGIRVTTDPGASMSERERADQARFIVTSAIVNLGLGVDKYFWFVYHHSALRELRFGTLTDSFTPRPAAVAYAVLSDVVSDGDYVGQIQALPDTVDGHILQNSADEEIAVLWAGTETTVDLPVRADRVTEVDLVGRTSERTAGGSISLDVGPNPIYVRTDGTLGLETAPLARAPPERALSTGLDPDVASRPDGRTRPDGSTASDDGSLTTAQRVVLAPQFPTGGSLPEDETIAERFASVTQPGARTVLAAGETHPVTLQVYNTNDEAVTVDLEGAAGDGWRVVDGAWTVEVDAGGLATLDVELAPGRDGGARVVDQRPAFLEFWGTVGDEPVPRSTALIVASEVFGDAFDHDRPALTAQLRNDGDTASAVQSVEWRFGDASGTASVDATVPPNGTETITVPVDEVPFYEFHDATLDVDVGVVSWRFRDEVMFSPIPVGAPYEDSSMRAPADGYVFTDKTEVYGGQEDLSMDATVWQSDEGLRVQAIVSDDVYFPNAACDNPEPRMAHDTLVVALEEYALAADDYRQGGERLGLWTGPEKAGYENVSVGEAAVSIERDDEAGEVRYDITIPWAVLGAIDRETPSTLTLWRLDHDGVLQTGRAWWSDDVVFLDGPS